MKILRKIYFLSFVLLAACTPTTIITPQADPPITPPTSTPTQPAPQPRENTILVTDETDHGPGTLRQALLDAKHGYTITFDPEVFPPDAPVTIFVTGEELPGIHTSNLTLDASSAGVILDGSRLQGDWIAGLQIISSDNNRIMGLQISNFPGPGIAISGEASDNVIGGDRSIGNGPWGQGNLLNNNKIGIGLALPGSQRNTVTGNLIGVDLEGSYWLGNAGFGVHIGEGAHANTIGPDNIIAYNGRNGIYVDPPESTQETIIDNTIFDNGIRIGWPDRPAIFDFDLAAGTLAGATCPNCQVEIYSASGYGEELEGGVLEGETKADEVGVFTFEKGGPFIGPSLTARTTNLRGRKSYFAFPLTSGAEHKLVLQNGNDLPRVQFFLEMPLALADNHLGSQYDQISYTADLSDSTYIYRGGFTRARVSIAGLEPEGADWDKPEFSISPEQYEHFTRMADKGITVKYVLMFWDKETYPHGDGAPCARFKTEGEIERWLGYVRFTVEHLKDYVGYFEIWNEPDIRDYCPKWIELEDYINLVRRTVPVFREAAPGARLVVGAVSKTFHEQDYLFGLVESDIMPLVDGVSWHPFYGESPKYEEERAYYYNYPDFVKRIKDTAAAHGFVGEFHADEVGWSMQPGGGQYGEYSRIETNKYFLRAVMQHRGMDISLGTGGGYVITRRLNALMAGVEPAELPVEIQSDAENIMSYTFSTLDGDRMLALWTHGIAVDHDPGVEATVTIPDFPARAVACIDLLHNLEQDLIFEMVDGDLVIRNLLLRDYPLMIKLNSDTP
jgi:hypothetical protein